MNGRAKLLWFAFLASLAVLAVLGLVFPYKGHFGLDELPLFGAWFGIAVAAAIVFLARFVSVILRREEHYYD